MALTWASGKSGEGYPIYSLVWEGDFPCPIPLIIRGTKGRRFVLELDGVTQGKAATLAACKKQAQELWDEAQDITIDDSHPTEAEADLAYRVHGGSRVGSSQEPVSNTPRVPDGWDMVDTSVPPDEFPDITSPEEMAYFHALAQQHMTEPHPHCCPKPQRPEVMGSAERRTDKDEATEPVEPKKPRKKAVSAKKRVTEREELAPEPEALPERDDSAVIPPPEELGKKYINGETDAAKITIIYDSKAEPEPDARTLFDMNNAIYTPGWVAEPEAIACTLCAIAKRLGVAIQDTRNLAHMTAGIAPGMLRERGIRPEWITPVVLAYAERIYPVLYQPATEDDKPSTSSGPARVEKSEPEKKLKQSIGGRGGKRFELFGFPITAVLRWMGTDAFTYKEARKALDHFGLEVADATIKAQLFAGKKGQRGPAADVDDKQAEELRKASEGA